MAIAAQAFTEKAVSELKPGSLFLLRQQWAFMGERQSKDPEGSDKEKFLALIQGQFRRPHTKKGLSLASPA